MEKKCKLARFTRCLLFVVCIVSTIGSLSAQVATTDTLEQKLPEVTVHATHGHNRLTSGTPIQTIDSKRLTDIGIATVSDAMKHIAGVLVKDYGGIGGVKSISVRNMGAAHTLVSYDGLVVSNCQAGQIDLGRFSTSNVQAITLAIGHDDDLLQPAKLYTAASTLNILTAHEVLHDGKRNSQWLTLRGGSWGQAEGAYRGNFQWSPQTQCTAYANVARADGNYAFTMDNGQQSETLKRNHSGILQHQQEINLFSRTHQGGKLQAKVYHYYSDRELPGAVVLYNPTSNEQLKDRNLFLQAQYRDEWKKHWQWRVAAKYNYAANRYDDKGPQYEDGTYNATYRQHEYYLTGTLLYKPLQGLRIALAEDGTMNHLHNDTPAGPFPTRWTWQQALTAQFKQHGLTVSGTLTTTHTKEHVRHGNKKPGNIGRLSPSAQVNWMPFQPIPLSLRLMYKHTFRMPSFNDLYYFDTGTKQLKPEKAQEVNAGVTWSGMGTGCLNRWSLTADGYYNTVTDKIVAYPSTYVWRMVNFGKVHITGLDVTLDSEWALGHFCSLDAALNYTWQHAIDMSDAQAKNYRQQLPYTPRHSGNAHLSLHTPWFQIGYAATAMGPRYFLPQNTEANKIMGYMEHGMSISRDFAMQNIQLHLQAEVKNIGNKQYEIIKNYPMPGRSWLLSTTIKL